MDPYRAASRSERLDFPSRVRLRAVTAGALVALGLMGVLLAVAAGFGLWPVGPFDVVSVAALGAGFWTWTSLCWIGSAFVGGFVAAVAARAVSVREGLIQGVVTWALACLVGSLLVGLTALRAIEVGLASPTAVAFALTPTTLLGLAIADVFAIGSALLGGVLGSRTEPRRFGERGERAPAAADMAPAEDRPDYDRHVPAR